MSKIISDNILNREFNQKTPNTHWVGDITYIRNHQGWSYLATVLDLATKEIVGWSLSQKPNAKLAKKALQNAIRRKHPDTSKLLFHSDRGVQYTSNLFVDFCVNLHITKSVSRKGNCWDNAVMERFFRSLKSERLNYLSFKSHQEVTEEVDNYKNVFTTDYKQIFGALKKNVKKEERYKEFYIARAKSTYKKLKKQPFVRILSRRKFKEKHSIPKLFQLKDYSDMLVLDYLLSQEDRFANIHYKTYYYSLKGKKIKKKLIKKKNKLTKNDIKENNILVVKRLVLKDNDCGVKRINRTRNSKIFKRISHMSFKTYRKLLYLNSVINKKETKTFFKTEALFTGKDWNRFRKLVKSLTSIVPKKM